MPVRRKGRAVRFYLFFKNKKLMKKTILLIAALFVVAMANAQITKIATLDGNVTVDADNVSCGNVLYGSESTENETKLTFYDDNFNNYKTLTINKADPINHVYIAQVSRNYFTTDGKISFIYDEYSGSLDSGFIIERCEIINEDGQIVYSFGKNYGEGCPVYKIGEHYYLLRETLTKIGTDNIWKTSIYQLPGNGEPSTDIDSAPAITPRAIRKAIRNGNVFVDTPEHIYTISGQVME